MSYCRCSSNNFMCDVYVYADCYGGWTIHVAGKKRIISPIPEPSYSMLTKVTGEWRADLQKVIYKNRRDEVVAWVMIRLWMLLRKPHLWSLAIIPLRKIGGPHDGESFNDDTAGECAERLLYLRTVGYKVPQYAIDALREEQEELK